jgi:hypothetical protein
VEDSTLVFVNVWIKGMPFAAIFIVWVFLILKHSVPPVPKNSAKVNVWHLRLTLEEASILAFLWPLAGVGIVAYLPYLLIGLLFGAKICASDKD